MPVFTKGLEGIVANSTRLSDVQGRKGTLVYAGYDINELAGKASFEEVLHLLWHGELPNDKELAYITTGLRSRRELPQDIIEFLVNAPRSAMPMDIIRTAVSMLGLYDSKIEEDINLDMDRIRAFHITAKIGVIAAYFHRARQGKSLPPIRTDLGEAAHFLYLLNDAEPSEDIVKALDAAYVLHADNGMSASTFSARVTIATLSDVYSAITSAIGTLKGPLHGGANEGVISMLEEIGSVERVDAWVEEQLVQKRKIHGIGHRVYKMRDPRAPVLRQLALNLSRKLDEPKWILMSERIAEIMEEREQPNANVDFYSATLYHSLGIPSDMFTPIFAIARAAGWTAHILEQLADNRLYRPLSEYVGPKSDRKFVPIERRQALRAPRQGVGVG